ncbi:MAG: SPOR domain-containing protein [Flavobacteriales bacterium]
MQGFEDIVIQLLLRHNCVVVPGFGGFVAKQVAAELDFQKGIISPPKKALLFNRFLLTDDGLLLAEYARQQGLYYEEAKNQLQDFTDSLQRRLHAGQTIQLPKLGTFSRSADGQIHFEQDRFFNLLLSSYGLANLNFIAVPKEEKEEAPIIHLDTTPTPSKVNWAKLAAAACFLPIAFYSVWIPTQTSALQSGLFSTSDFNPLHKQEAPAYQKTKIQLSVLAPSTASKLAFEQAPQTTFATYEWLPGHAVRVRIPAAPIQTASTQTIALNEQSAEPVQQAAYDFIVGCFSNLQNAQNLQRKLQRDGFAARLIQTGPLTKVSLGAAQNLSELQTLQQQASARGLQGWVLTN